MVLTTDQKSQEEGITLLKPPKETELHRDDLPRTLTEERSPEVPASPEGQSTWLMGLGWLEGSVWGLCLAVQLLPSEQETCNSVLNWQHRKHWKVGPVLCRPRLEGGPRQMEGILSTHLCSPDTKLQTIKRHQCGNVARQRPAKNVKYSIPLNTQKIQVIYLKTAYFHLEIYMYIYLL